MISMASSTRFFSMPTGNTAAPISKLPISRSTTRNSPKRHLAAKLLVGNDDRVLDIGSGWGGLALYLAEVCRARVTGITLSQQQHAAARVRASEKGLAERTDFHPQDYREVSGKFDRIVSVGMFEHVGVASYGTLFRK